MLGTGCQAHHPTEEMHMRFMNDYDIDPFCTRENASFEIVEVSA